MKARTEDDILVVTPLSVKFADKDYSIPLLTVFAQRLWRKNLLAELAPIVEAFNFRVDSKSMAMGLTAALLNFPDKLADLLFAYREYGFLWESLVKDGIPDKLLVATFTSRLGEGPLTEAPDFPRDSILLHATEEQIASAFSSIMVVAFPFLPQLGMVTTLLRSVQTASPTLQ